MATGTDVAIEIEAEAKVQGLTEIQQTAQEIIRLAGAGELASNAVESLKYVLSTIKSGDVGNLQSVSSQLVSTLRSLKQILASSKDVSKFNKKNNDLARNVYQTTVSNVTRAKQDAGVGLSNDDTIALQTIANLAGEYIDATKNLSEKISEISRSLDGANASGAQIQALASMVNQKNKADRILMEKEDRVKAEEEKRRFDQHLKDAGLYDKYYSDKQNLKYLQEQASIFRSQRRIERGIKGSFVGNSLKDNVRQGLYNVEETFNAKRGFTGFFSQFGKNLFAQSKLGNILPKSGFGINLGTIGFGLFAEGLKKAGKAVLNFASEAKDAYIEIEKVKTNLGVVYGTQGEADRIYQEIAQYAVKSPFGVQQTAEQATLLKQSGVENADVMNILKMFGDLAGGNQEKFNRIALNFSQITANETANARNLRQFTMAGIPIYEALSKTMGIDKSEVRNAVKKNEVSASDIEKALKSLTQEGGPFFQAVEKGARTMAARITNLNDVKQIAQANIQEADKWYLPLESIQRSWLAIQEKFWNSLNESSEKKVKSKRSKASNKYEGIFSSLDESKSMANAIGDELAVRALTVQEMKVESMSRYTRDQMESFNMTELSDAFDKFNNFTQQDLKSLAKAYEDTKYGLSQQELNIYNKILKETGNKEQALKISGEYANSKANGIIELLRSNGASEDMIRALVSNSKYNDLYRIGQVNNGSHSQTYEAVNKMGSFNFKKQFDEEFEKAFKTLSKITSMERYVVPGMGYIRNWTAKERDYYKIFNSEGMEVAAGNTRKLSKDKNAGANIMSEVYKLYEQSDAGKAEKEKEQAEMVQTLKDIYQETKDMHLDQNKFGFVKTTDTAKDIVSKSKRYLDLDNAEKIAFANEESFTEDRKLLNDNITSMKDAFLNLYRQEQFSTKGNEGNSKYVESLLGRMENAPDLTAARKANVEFLRLIDSVKSDDLKAVMSLMVSNVKALDIDPNKLDIEKHRKVNYTADESYANLQRRLIRDTLGVSLYRTMYKDVGLTSGEYGVKNNVAPVMTYFQNNENRKANYNMARAFLNQRDFGKTMSYADISRLIAQGDDRLYSNFGVRNFKNGQQVTTGTLASGRMRKGFIDQDRTRNNFERLALSAEGTVEASKQLYNNINSTIEKLDDFFAQSFTTDDQQELSTQTLKLLDMEARIKRGDTVYDEKGHLVDATEWNNNKNYAPLLKTLLEDSKLTQLGYSGAEDFRTQLAGFSHQLELAKDGTITYKEVLQQMVAEKREELKSIALIINAATDFKEALKSIDDEIKSSQNKGIAEAFTNYGDLKATGLKDSAMQPYIEKLTGIVNNNEEYFKSVFGNKPIKEIVSDIISENAKRVRAGDKTLGLRSGFDIILDEKNKIKTGAQTATERKQELEKQLKEAQAKQSGAKGYTLKSDAWYKEYALKMFDKNNQLNLAANPNNLSIIREENEKRKAEYNKARKQAGGNWEQYKQRDIDYLTNYRDDEVASLEDSIKQLTQQIEELNNSDSAFSKTNYEKETLVDAAYGLSVKSANKDIADTNLQYSKILGEFKKNADKLFSLYDTPEDIGNTVHPLSGILTGNSDNTYSQNKLLEALGLKGESFKDVMSAILKDNFINADGSLNEGNFEDLTKIGSKLGVDDANLERIKLTGILSEKDVNTLEAYTEKVMKLGVSWKNVKDRCDELNETMKEAFKGAVVDSISNAMVTLGESVRDSADATENLNKGLRETWSNLLKSIGPQMTKTGLQIAGESAVAHNWGGVVTGLGLAAAGGFMSWAGGLISPKDEKDDDKDAQREARLKSLADILGDLINQAKTDAEYYERNVMHRRAISEDYGVSSTKVNDMIITPEGNFSTHPEDTIMAMKHPEDLLNMNNSYSGKMPEIRVRLIAENGSPLQIASQSQSKDAQGNVDIQAIIVTTTADAIANGDMDGAFAQMQARQKGLNKTF